MGLSPKTVLSLHSACCCSVKPEEGDEAAAPLDCAPDGCVSCDVLPQDLTGAVRWGGDAAMGVWCDALD